MTKILLISSNFLSKTDSTKSYEAILSSFKKEELAQLCFRPRASSGIDFDFVSSFFLISEVDIIKSFFTNRKCGRCIIEKDSSPSKKSKSASWYSWISETKFRRWSIIRDMLWSSNRWDNEKLDNWIKNFNPDIILTIAGAEEFYCKITKTISNRYKVPYVVYYTDDYVLNYKPSGIWGNYLRKKRHKYFADFIEGASLRYCIGSTMSQDYSRCFNKAFIPIMNSVDVSPFVPNNNNNKKCVISYFGSLHLHRWLMISKFSDVVNEYCEIHIYTGSELTSEMKNSLNKDNIILKGKVSANDINSEMYRSDFLLHIESDEPYFSNLTHYSISTKIPEYLMSCRPIICYAPIDLASVHLIKDNSLGLVLNPSEDVTYNRKALVKFVNDKSIYDILSKRGYQYAVSNFNRQQISSLFRIRIEDILNG